MTIEAGSGPDVPAAPGTSGSGGARGPAQPSGGASRQRRLVVRGIQLDAMARFLSSRRFLSYVITAVLGARALASLAQESQTRNVARLSAWDQKRKLRDERKTKPRSGRAG